MTKEEKVYNIVAEKPFYIQLGGEKVRLLPTTLSDDYKIGSIIAKISDVVDSEFITDKDILSLLNAKEIATIISTLAKSTIGNSFINSIDTYFRRRKAYNLAYKKASKEQIGIAIVSIIPQMQLFFYRRCIISLKGMATMKPTKETEAIAPMPS